MTTQQAPQQVGAVVPDGAREHAAVRLQVGALVAVSLFSGFALNVFNGSLPIYLHGVQGYSLEAVGVLVGLASVPQLLSPLFAGPLINGRGPRVAIRAGTAVSLLAGGIFMVTGSAAGLAVARLLQGVAYALVLPATYALLPRLIPRRRLGTATGAFGTVPSLALAIGPPVGISLLQLGPDALFAGALVGAALALAATFALPGAAPAEGRQRLLALDRRWLPLLAVTFLTVVYWGIITAYLPLHVPAASRSSVGWFFTADAVGVLAMRIPAGYLTDRHGPRWLLVGGILLTAVAVLVLMLPATTLILVLAGIGTGAGAAFLLPPIIIELSALSDNSNRGSAMALYTCMFAAAVAVGSLAGAPIVVALGFNAALLMSVAACLAALPIAVLSTEHRRGRAAG